MSETKDCELEKYTWIHSQAKEKFQSWEQFGIILEEKFNKGAGKVKVSHWACCREEYQEGGFHYNRSLKLTCLKKWLTVFSYTLVMSITIIDTQLIDTYVKRMLM